MDKQNTKYDDQEADEVIREYNQLSGNRMNWESHWTEIAQRFYPSHSSLFQSRGMLATKGEKRMEEVLDSAGVIALSRFAAILYSLLIPRSQTWHRLSPSDPYLNKDRQTRLYFEEVNRLLFHHRYAPRANFSAQAHQNFESLGAYGTGAIFVDDLISERGVRDGLRYRNIHLSEIYFSENHQGIVDKAIRHFPLTARQAVQKFGADLPEQITAAAATTPDREFFFLNCVKPRQDLDLERKDYKGMPYVSYYVSIDGKKLIREGGFTSFRYAVSRYRQITGETYGRSPAMDALPANKTLQEEKKTLLKQGHRALDPILLAHDDGVLDGFSFKPGALNYGGVSADGRPLVHALPVGNIAVGKDLMDDERKVQNDAFLVSLFQLLIDSPQKTATEVLELAKEKGILTAPHLGRQQDEGLGSLIEIEIDILSSQGKLPPQPQLLREAKGEYKIIYDSPFNRSQRAEEAAGLMRSIELALQVVNVTQNPEPLDFYDWDIIVPEVNDIQGVPMRWMKSLDAVQAVRQGRAQDKQDQKLIQAAPAAASVVKAVAPTK